MRAISLYHEAQALCREAGDIDLLRWAVGNEAEAHLRLGDFDRAELLTLEALRLSLDLQSPWGIVAGLFNLAWVLGVTEKYEQAAVIHAIAEGQKRRFGIGYPTWHGRPDLPDVEAALGDETYNALQARGRAMKFDEAIAYVLAVESQMPQAVSLAGGRAAGHGLSRRELEVLRLIVRGMSNHQMADSLVISVRTVERHINHIYDKLEVRNRAQATAFALTHQLVSTPG